MTLLALIMSSAAKMCSATPRTLDQRSGGDREHKSARDDVGENCALWGVVAKWVDRGLVSHGLGELGRLFRRLADVSEWRFSAKDGR